MTGGGPVRCTRRRWACSGTAKDRATIHVSALAHPERRGRHPRSSVQLSSRMRGVSRSGLPQGEVTSRGNAQYLAGPPGLTIRSFSKKEKTQMPLVVTPDVLRSTQRTIESALERYAIANGYPSTHTSAPRSGAGRPKPSVNTAGADQRTFSRPSPGGMRLANGLGQAAALMEQHENETPLTASAASPPTPDPKDNESSSHD